MLEICRVFGGSLDLQKAEAIERAMEFSDLEVGDDLIEAVIAEAYEHGNADYVGHLVDYCTNAIAEDFREVIEEAGFGEFWVNPVSYPNYMASSAEIKIEFDAEELATAEEEKIANLTTSLKETYDFHSTLIDEIRLSITVEVGNSTIGDFDEFVDFLREMPANKEEREAFFKERGILE